MSNRRSFITGVAGLAAATAMPKVFAQAATASGAAEPTLARVQRTKTLRIGAVRGAAPYYNKDLASGEWGGFMIDFARSLAASLNVKLDITETTWGNSVLDLQTHKIDLFFGMNPTPARREVINFSEPLFLNAFTIVSKKEFKTWADLDKPEVKIGVDIGSSHDQLVSRVCPHATIMRLEKADDATLALQTGRVDAQVLVWLLALNILKKNPALGKMTVPQPLEATSTNIGLPKEDDKAWAEAVNKWIAAERAAGKIKPTVLGNLQKLSGVKPEEVPAQIPL
ncbi:transporter substrate-binding domain-containing protein [Herbaspirillum rubrisubalbicans]|uniref:transporter substrate-binding domain-containing protein n=1 Tax=Herbaspirillum rubrisubalbicans TaxID=80842 RepID=UPI00155899F3|nr:transporter substrate-binding domain-containing protein [Herbaspirillum rubrisubalbicans]NQE50753.1 ABC transporter substrate-binding protein [Herbaspirillum rubrisubalbicans]